jgi:hypothetical protein
MRTRQTLGMLAVTALVVAGCGGNDDEPAAEKRTTERNQIRLTVETEAYTEVTKDVAEVAGTVAPEDATVEVDGVTATATSGAWTSRVRLDTVGENKVEIHATAPGYEDAEATTVLVRKHTKAELAAERARRARQQERERRLRAEEAERRRQEAAERRAARQTTVPNLIGERLDVAKDELREVGLRSRVIGGGTFGVIVESNWTVCQTEPGPGSGAQKGNRVELIVDRVC